MNVSYNFFQSRLYWQAWGISNHPVKLLYVSDKTEIYVTCRFEYPTFCWNWIGNAHRVDCGAYSRRPNLRKVSVIYFKKMFWAHYAKECRKYRRMNTFMNGLRARTDGWEGRFRLCCHGTAWRVSDPARRSRLLLAQKKSTCITRLFFRSLHKYLISFISVDHAFVPYYDTERSANMKMINHFIITQPALPLAPCHSWVKRPQVQNVL